MIRSSQARGVPPSAQVDEDSISSYLKQHPDFFERHQPLLASLRLPHARTGAISLVERQIEMLREKHEKLERRLNELIEVARANDVLAEKIHRLTRRLLVADSRAVAVAQLESSLREDFGAVQSVLVLIGATGAGLEQFGRFVRALPAGDAHLASFDGLFASGKPRCGQVRDSQRDFLFGAGTVDVGSLALVPLGGKNGGIGLLALASHDRERFHPGMATEFLARMGELVSDALKRV